MAVQPPFPPAPPSQVESDYARPGYYGPTSRPPTNFSNQIRSWIDVIVRGRWWILGAVLLIATPVAIYAALADNIYQSAARLRIESTGASDLTAVMPGQILPMGSSQSMISDELYILQHAEDLAMATAEKILDQADAATASQLSVLNSSTGELPSVEVVAARVPQYIHVIQDGDGVNAVRVQGQSLVPAEAAMIANLYAQAYVDRTQTSSRASVTASRSFLEAQVDSVASELTIREQRIGDYMEQEDAVRLDEEQSGLVMRLGNLQASRDAAGVETQMLAATVRQLEQEIAQLERSVGESMRSSAQRDLEIARGRIIELEGQLVTQLRRREQGQPDRVDEIREEIQQQQEVIDGASVEITGNVIGPTEASTAFGRLSALRDQLSEARIQLAGKRSSLGVLNNRIASSQQDLEQIPSQSIELARLMRDRATTEALAASLEQKLQETRVAEQAELGYAEIVKHAGVPGQPIAPNRERIILLGLMLGLGLGIALAIGRDQFDQRIRRPDDIRNAGYPLLGVIPSVQSLIEKDFAGLDQVEVDGRTFDSHLTALLAPTAQASEAYRGLRTSVQFSRPDTVVRRILVTSASPGEGKSTVAANLATVMAQSGRRTLLIDGDLRRSRVHKMFGMSRSPGITDVLTSRESVPIQPRTVADGFDVLPAGSPVPNPSEHLGSRALRDWLDSLQETYDVIIVDAPPLMAATDPVLLATQADGTIIVAAAGQTKDFELAYVHNELSYVGAHVIGVVLNRFDVTKEYGYRYQYNYRYGNNYTYGAEGATA